MTYYIVQYNDRYGNGQNKTYECLVKSEAEFERWLKKYNKEREDDGEMVEGADEFDLIPINLYEL